MSTQAVPVVSPRAPRLLGSAFTIGGMLWIGDFVQIVVNGAITGSLPIAPDPLQPLVLRIGLRLFVLSIVVLGTALTSLLILVKSRSTKLAISGLVFTAIALVLATVNLATLSGLAGTPILNDTFMGLSVFAIAIATAFMSVAALRTHALPRWAAITLMFVGISTIPVLFGTPLPLGPDWATDHLAFLTSGLAYTIVGGGLWVAQKRCSTHVQ
jgi:hypothetical protein